MTKKTASILIIDDDLDMCMLLGKYLMKNGYAADCAHFGKTALEKISKNFFDIVFCDFRLSDTDGRILLQEIKKISPETEVIIITGYSDVKMAVEVIKLGASDYVTKPLIPEEILLLVNNLIDKSTSKTTIEKKEIPFVVSDNFITGQSAEATEIHRQIKLVAPTNYTVIIQGESGTGKESVAKLIQQNSSRNTQAFVAIDCGTLSRELAGSELFGHEKGAFTGAIETKIGCFELANNGTLFLDEVANLPYDVQVTLLRVVQEKKIRRIGGITEIPVDVRIIVASNENLSTAVKKGKFREDLYHRFNEFNLHVSPLRERKDDIEIFANYFLNLAKHELNKPNLDFDSETIECFKNYNWPGNLRELKNVIKRAALLTEGKTIQIKSLPQEIIYFTKLQFTQENNEKENSTLATNYNKVDLKSVAHHAEYELILDVLKKVQYNKTKAAELLNIDRKTLYNKMKNLNI
ncbi:MAG: sigma-54 dependent transcriptional regulator [Bacteroidota bacterium]